MKKQPMEDPYIVERRIVAEDEIKNEKSNFLTVYYAVYYLQSLAKTNPQAIEPGTIYILLELLKSDRFSRQRQCLFLFRQAAETLSNIVIYSGENKRSDLALTALKSVLGETSGHAHRATAECLSGLPLLIKGPELRNEKLERIPLVAWQQLLLHRNLNNMDRPVFVGRSLVAETCDKKKLAVFKLALKEDSPDALFHEACWMNYLREKKFNRLHIRFHIPEIVKVENSIVFRLKDIPPGFEEKKRLHEKGYAICFIADKEYFSYPNDHREEIRPSEEWFKEIMVRNAWLLGSLAGLGILHSAPIPLFHNRVQRQRRRDAGLYEWFRGGRLDKWLESCAYPNLGITGLRDFEHLLAFSGQNRILYRHIGNHFLSMLLILGSYFRNKDKERVGIDKLGNPVDARDLFNEPLLKELIEGIFVNYYNGFVKNNYNGELPFSIEKLSRRMIEEMGVDNYMEEILRVADQNEMTDEEFMEFFHVRGYHKEETNHLKRGVEDIVILSGPHLGRFNQRISLPEIIEAVSSMSALCILGRYNKEKNSLVKRQA